MNLVDSYRILERLYDLLYDLLELRDEKREEGLEPMPIREATPLVKLGLPSMLKKGVIMDVTNSEQALIAEASRRAGQD